MSEEAGLELNEKQKAEVEWQLKVIKRGLVEIVPEDGLRRKVEQSVASGKPLKVKLGVDPSAPDIHVGHTVVLHKLRQFQELGHGVQLLIGDFTARIGDPTGKSETRKQLSEEEVKTNAQTYVEQFGKILDMDRVELNYNSRWLSAMDFADVIGLAANVTVARMLERDDFEKRYRSGQAIALHEFFYPLMQGYDSVALESDIELGGTDQTFNLLVGRSLQREFGQSQQVALTLPLLEGLDGAKKMSKSLGNYIGIEEPPNEIFGKAMSVPDALMLKYYEIATDLPTDQFENLAEGLREGRRHPRDAKTDLARMFVRMYHGEEAAREAEQHFKTVFQQRRLPDEIPQKTLPPEFLSEDRVWIVKLLSALELVSSNGEARRMIKQGAVKVNEEKVTDAAWELKPEEDMIVQVGKRKFAQIKK